MSACTSSVLAISDVRRFALIEVMARHTVGGQFHEDIAEVQSLARWRERCDPQSMVDCIRSSPDIRAIVYSADRDVHPKIPRLIGASKPGVSVGGRTFIVGESPVRGTRSDLLVSEPGIQLAAGAGLQTP